MKNQPLLSIIIPVYKVEQYIRKCIDSILTQSFRDFELILVDDGSPDSSGRICDTYIKTDERVKVIHNENAGVSSARNSGLDIATGKWVCFIDSDDFIPQGSLAEMTDIAKENEVDMLIFNHCIIEEDGSISGSELKLTDGLFSPDKVISDIIRYNIPTGPVARLFKRELIRDIRFRKDLYIGEDMYFNIEYMRNVTSDIYISDLNVYYYLNRQGSAMNNDSYFDGLMQLDKALHDYISKQYPDKTFDFDLSCFSFNNAVSAIKKRPSHCIKYKKEIMEIFFNTKGDVLELRDKRVNQIYKLYKSSNLACYVFLLMINTLSRIKQS